MPCALEPASGPPPTSYLTAASDLCVQENLWSSAEQGDIRQGNDLRLHNLEPMAVDDEPSNDAAVDPPSEAKDCTSLSSEARVGLLTIQALKDRILLMLAAAGGGPIASGVGAILARANISHQLISDVVTAVEKAFSEHGERALRENCGGKLAKDESYGFLLTDLVIGTVIPREDAITLGEKLRKENKKIKTKKDWFRDGRSRALAKLPVDERVEAGAEWDRRRDAYLSAICEAELPIPRLVSAVAGVREEVKQEVKQEAVKQGPAAAPLPPRAPLQPSLEDLHDAAEAAWKSSQRLRAECREGWEKAERFAKALERRGEPQPPPRARGAASMLAGDLSAEEFAARSKSFDERRDAYLSELREYTRKRTEYKDMISALQLLARDADAAISAWKAADALYEQRKATIEAELQAAEMQAAFAELLLRQDRAPATGRASQLDLSGGLEVKINGQGLSSPRVCTSAYEVS